MAESLDAWALVYSPGVGVLRCAKEANVLKGGPFWNRLAAATGIDFVAIGVAIAILAQTKDFENSADFIGASNEVWGTYVLLLGVAAALFMWFTSTFVA